MRAQFALRFPALLVVAALSVHAARPAAAQGSGLVAAYGFGEGAGSVAADASGNGNHGSISGATWGTGVFGSALAFDGQNDVVIVGDSASLDLTNGMTLEAWVRPTSALSGWKALVAKDVDAFYLYANSPSNHSLTGGTFNGSCCTTLEAPTTLPLNQWTHVAGTYDGATLRLYLNGAQVASMSRTGSLQVNSLPLRIGGSSFGNEFFPGLIDEVRIYNRALSAGEIQLDMNTAISGGTPPPPPPGTGIGVSWMQPAGSALVDEFRVYKNATLGGQGTLIYAGIPAPDASGIYSTTVQIDEIAQGIPMYVWLTAANSVGESAPSNANLYPEGCNPSLDTDCDGVPDDGAPGFAPCATGQSQNCDDNCRYWPNAGQDDRGGIGALASIPDGIGDVCQCGDVSGDGRVTTADSIIIQRSLLLPPTATMSQPDLCDVGGSAGCSTSDAVIVKRAQGTPPSATIQQQCDPALMP